MVVASFFARAVTEHELHFLGHWSMRHHRQHFRHLRKAVETMLLIHLRQARLASIVSTRQALALPWLPKEMWLEFFSYLSSLDFVSYNMGSLDFVSYKMGSLDFVSDARELNTA